MADQLGLRQLEVHHNSEGKVYCLLEAPDAEAVRRHHGGAGGALRRCPGSTEPPVSDRPLVDDYGK